MMLQIQRAVAHASAVVLGHSYSSDVQRQVADVLFAKASADGQLSASLGELFPTGAGVTITPKTPLHFVPEEYGLSSAHLKRIDSIALDGIRQGAYPGCQVVVLKTVILCSTRLSVLIRVKEVLVSNRRISTIWLLFQKRRVPCLPL